MSKNSKTTKTTASSRHNSSRKTSGKTSGKTSAKTSDHKQPASAKATAQRSAGQGRVNDSARFKAPPVQLYSDPVRPNYSTRVYEFVVQSLSHEGRGVAHYSSDNPQHPANKHGKKVFIRQALPGEIVEARVSHESARFEEAEMVRVLQASPHREVEFCPHVERCGGCSLQHLSVVQQLQHKQQVLASHLQHFAGIQPQQWLPAIFNSRQDYRRRARVSVRYLHKSKQLQIGFRQAASQHIAELSNCAVLHHDLNQLLQQLPSVLGALQQPAAIGHIELAKGDHSCSVLIRHTAALIASDQAQLLAWAVTQSCQLFLQANQQAPVALYLAGEQANSIEQVLRSENAINDVAAQTSSSMLGSAALATLGYALPAFDLKFAFAPTDFTQVNAEVNAQMVQQACDLLELKSGQRVLDLFCGLGNFTLAMARLVGETGLVVGVEASTEMVARAQANAQSNAMAQAQFVACDLTQPLTQQPWAQQQFDAILLDPPRAGAVEILPYIVQFGASKIVYVSCDPATLARDAGVLKQHGYTLACAGIMDMFSHTRHVESIALFEKNALATPTAISTLGHLHQARTKGDGYGHGT